MLGYYYCDRLMNDLLIEKRGHVLWLTINRPEQRNALNNEVLAALTDALRDAKSDHSVRAIVLTGAGDKAFSAGGDLKGGSGKGDADGKKPSGPFVIDYSRVEHALVTYFEEIERCPVPIVARVNGHAMGGGLGLVASADIAIAADHALFATPEVKAGLFPALILTYLVRVMPRRKLAEMAIVGEPMTAAQALEYGLLNAVVPLAELDAKVDTLLATILQRSPTAIRLGKHGLHAVQDMTLSQCLDYMQLMVGRMVLTEDAVEGLAAFTTKRKPLWTGR